MKFFSNLINAFQAKAKSVLSLSDLPATRYNSKVLKQASKSNLINSYNSIVYSCVQLNANAVSEIPWRVVGKNRKGESVDENNSIPAILLSSANPFMEWTGLIKLTQSWLDVAGCAFWWVRFSPNGMPEGIFPLPPTQVEFSKDKNADTDFIFFNSGKEKIKINASELVIFRMPSLSNPYTGSFSPLQAVWKEKAMWDEETINAIALLQNHARPDAVISPKNSEQGLGEPERRAFERQLKNKFKRAGAGGILVSTEALDYQTLTFSSKDAELLARKQVTKVDIANAFSIPLALLQTENINRATLEASMFQHGFYSIKPRIKYIQETLNEFFFPMFKGDLRIIFENPVPIDKEKQAKLDEIDLKNGVITINEIRERRGIEAVEWGNEPWLPMNNTQPSTRIELVNGANNNVKKLSSKKQNNKNSLDDLHKVFIGWKLGECDLFKLYEEAKKSGVKSSRIKNWCKDLELPEPCEKICCSPDSKKLEEFKAVNSIPSHKPLEKTLRREFIKQEKDVMKALRKNIKSFESDSADFINDIDFTDWENKLAREIQPDLLDDANKGISKTIRLVSAGGASVSVLDNMEKFRENATLLKSVTEQSIILSESTVATTQKSMEGAIKAIKQALKDGIIKEGDALPEMTKRMQAIFTNAKQHRARAIAVTESNKAFNNATLLSAKDSNVVTAVKWVLSPKPCIICQTIAGEVEGIEGTPEVPIGTKFTNTDKLFGDVEHPPAHVNCECTLGVVLIDF